MVTGQTEQVTLLYTAALEGRLAILSRLFTRIRMERANRGGPVLLVDLGRACVPGSWICDVTQGRAMLVAMDAMGYDAFHIGPRDPLYAQPTTVQELRAMLLTPFAAGPWTARVTRNEQVFAFASRADLVRESAALTVILGLGDSPRVEVLNGPRRVIWLDPGWTQAEPLLGRLHIALTPEAPYIEIISQTQLDLSPDLLPDPTITGIVEFVESEARQAEQRAHR